MTVLLKVSDVSRRFGGLLALDNVSFELREGEILGIIGPNGAGKSTLFNVITGYISAQKGEIFLKEVKLSGRPPEVIARLGVVKTFQTPRLFGSMSFIDNVAVAALSRIRDLRKARAEALEFLQRVQLETWQNLSARGASTGQRKRLEIARALATGPRLLLLDEPLGGVDPGSIQALLALLKNIRDQGVTLLVIEHNLEAINALADRLVAMNLGQKIAEGLPNEVTRDPRVVRAYLGGEENATA